MLLLVLWSQKKKKHHYNKTYQIETKKKNVDLISLTNPKQNINK